ncbi:MAG: bdbD 1 [Alphaproteobacteria bacterium]|nr:bdbD 1 [Alphaproteobacteria bacterium]
MSRKSWIVIVVVLLAAVAGGAWYFLKDSDDAAAVTTAQSGPGYTITPRDMTIGDPKAKVVLIEYAAPVCPHCAHFNETTFPLLKKNYIDTGKVFYVFRVLPILPEDGPAEKLARCQPRDKYFDFIDMLFRNQSKWDPEFGITDVRGGLLELSKSKGMSEDDFNKCIADTKGDDIINAVAKDGADKYGLTSTPSIVINGTLRAGMAEYPALQAELDKEIAKK